jgi:hypothetical protein
VQARGEPLLVDGKLPEPFGGKGVEEGVLQAAVLEVGGKKDDRIGTEGIGLSGKAFQGHL